MRRMMPDTDHFDPTRDQPKTIEIPVKNNVIRIQKAGPNGFWRISYERGVTPRQLQGDWLGVQDARNAVQAYLQSAGDNGRQHKGE